MNLHPEHLRLIEKQIAAAAQEGDERTTLKLSNELKFASHLNVAKTQDTRNRTAGKIKGDLSSHPAFAFADTNFHSHLSYLAYVQDYTLQQHNLAINQFKRVNGEYRSAA